MRPAPGSRSRDLRTRRGRLVWLTPPPQEVHTASAHQAAPPRLTPPLSLHAPPAPHTTYPFLHPPQARCRCVSLLHGLHPVADSAAPSAAQALHLPCEQECSEGAHRGRVQRREDHAASVRDGRDQQDGRLPEAEPAGQGARRGRKVSERRRAVPADRPRGAAARLAWRCSVSAAVQPAEPLSQVPTLETPEGGIFESNAIARFVARQAPSGLLGATAVEAVRGGRRSLTARRSGLVLSTLCPPLHRRKWTCGSTTPATRLTAR